MPTSTEEKRALHTGHRDRMRARFLSHGFESMQEHEVLELILYYAVPRRDTNDIAHHLIEKFGNLMGVLEAPIEELEKEKYISHQGAVLLKMFAKSGQLPVLFDRRRSFAHSPINAIEVVQRMLEGRQKEEILVVCLDAKDKLLRHFSVEGTVNAVAISHREILQRILNAGAVSVIIGHNHPTGDATPSDADVETTFKLKNMLKAVGIRLYDHVVVARNGSFSFALNGMLSYGNEK